MDTSLRSFLLSPHACLQSNFPEFNPTQPSTSPLQFTPAFIHKIADQFDPRVHVSTLPSEPPSPTLTSLLSPSTSNFACGQMFKKGDLIYYCFTCGFDPSCVLCPKCFQAQHHEQHDIYVHSTQQAGGCCDCGDGEAWKVQLDCPYHGTCGPAQSSLLQLSKGTPS
ncbi:hypothetical protein HMI54_004056 [Coelomomyces lativittatus]|nr:hypothetical protein HMI56_000552 [Coelomomyces lativittatus]KAJ1507504.1 hypothetical protein HMI54_004056 [Coelomomyces lativittatus]KAJ1517030.1 hypothetical protein HMI55_000811 [Coelomomyces lativittatus]